MVWYTVTASDVLRCIFGLLCDARCLRCMTVWDFILLCGETYSAMRSLPPATARRKLALYIRAHWRVIVIHSLCIVVSSRRSLRAEHCAFLVPYVSFCLQFSDCLYFFWGVVHLFFVFLASLWVCQFYVLFFLLLDSRRLSALGLWICSLFFFVVGSVFACACQVPHFFGTLCVFAPLYWFFSCDYLVFFGGGFGSCFLYLFVCLYWGCFLVLCCVGSMWWYCLGALSSGVFWAFVFVSGALWIVFSFCFWVFFICCNYCMFYSSWLSIIRWPAKFMPKDALNI